MVSHVDNAQVQDGVINISGIQALAQLVAAPSNGKMVRLLGYVMTVPAGSTITWKSNTTPKSGPMALPSGVAAPTAGQAGRLFQCAANEALNLTTDTAGTYAGHFSYQIVEALS